MSHFIGSFPEVGLPTMLRSIANYCRERKIDAWVCMTAPASPRYWACSTKHAACNPLVGTALYRIRPNGEIEPTQACAQLATSDAILSTLNRHVAQAEFSRQAARA